jgi:hypothetical protein
MRIQILTILFLVVQTDYDNFKNTFPKIENDEYGNYLTRSLNKKDYPQLSEEYPLIPDSSSFTYICDGDSSKFKFTYGLYDMDKDKVTGYVNQKYKHFAIFSITEPKFDLVLYSRFDNKSERFVVRSFSKKGKKIDELIVNEEIRSYTSASLDRFSYSLINSDSIKVFNYKNVKNPKKEDENSGLVTKVIIENYAIDTLGRFNKVDMDSVLLSKSMSVYTKFDREPEVDDPIYKYWTLW